MVESKIVGYDNLGNPVYDSVYGVIEPGFTGAGSVSDSVKIKEETLYNKAENLVSILGSIYNYFPSEQVERISVDLGGDILKYGANLIDSLDVAVQTGDMSKFNVLYGGLTNSIANFLISIGIRAIGKEVIVVPKDKWNVTNEDILSDATIYNKMGEQAWASYISNVIRTMVYEVTNVSSKGEGGYGGDIGTYPTWFSKNWAYSKNGGGSNSGWLKSRFGDYFIRKIIY